MNTIFKLAISRIKYNKSQSILTVIAIFLTTCLLMSIGTTAIGLIDGQQKIISQQTGNHHASFNVDKSQLEILKNHIDIEALATREKFAPVVKDKMKANLVVLENQIEGIRNVELEEGKLPESEFEITGPPSFFTRIGYEPKIGNKVDISFRVKGDGEIITEQFTIVGILKQVDMSKVDIADTRIVYSAFVSKQMADNYLKDDEREFSALIRINGEESLNYDQIESAIIDIGNNIGVSEKYVNLNDMYLIWMTDPGSETLKITISISALVILFSVLVIYSIYYVSIITNIQEIGKLQALGISKKQLRKLLLYEGLILSAISIPFGLIVGYFIIYIRLPIIMNYGSIKIDMFSLPIILGVVLAVLVAVVISLFKPIRMATKISPVEAIRYQENTGNKMLRKGHEMITLSSLSYANLSRNRKRTFITILSMGISCVLFMAIAGVLNSMDILDYARGHLPKGDFQLNLEYKLNDTTYPENNLNSLQLKNYLGQDMISRILAISGVTNVEAEKEIMVHTNFSIYKGKNTIFRICGREDIENMAKDLKRGNLDYDEMVQQNGISFCSDYFFEEYNMSIGDIIPITLYDGLKEINLETKLMASTLTSAGDFAIPQDLIDNLIKDTNLTTSLVIYVDKDSYDLVKSELQTIVDENAYFSLVSLDEELSVAKALINMTKYPVYSLLLIIGVISFMNLINTMITSVVIRKRELGILQAIGMSDKQLIKMLSKEGTVFTIGTLLCALTFGNLLGYLAFKWAKINHFMQVTDYHYPIVETIVLIVVIVVGQLLINLFINKRIHKESLIDRIRQQE